MVLLELSKDVPAAATLAVAPGGRVLRLDLEYDGSRFSGWASQPGLRTVEGSCGTPSPRCSASRRS